MYRLLIFFLLLVGASPLSSFGDSGTTLISGKAVDSLSRKGVPFVTVTVQNSQSKILKRLASDANGSFEFSLKEDLKGEVIVSAIGYKPVKVKFAAGSKPKETLGSITMCESSAKIDQVVVQAQKQLVKIDVDKISYNTDADPESQTSNALDMLRKVPLITVDGEDNIKMKGSSNFKILVNGKESTLMSSNPKDVLKGMPASSIKNVEVITNPSSKYSAEGVGGIINIVTTKKTLEGVTGSVNLRADNIGGYGGSFYTTAKIGKLSFSLNYGPNYRKEKKSTSNTIMENFLSTTNHRTETFSSSDGNSVSNFGSGEMSYEIDSLNLISMSFWGYGGKWKGNPDGLTSVYDDKGNLFQQFSQVNSYKRTYGSVSGNIDYQRSFKKPDKLFTVSYKLNYDPSGTDNEFAVTGIKNYADVQNKSKNDAASYENTFQIDFVNPITEKHQYEVGTKYIIRTNPSETNYYNFVNTDWVEDPSRYNKLTYTQNIVAAYVGYLYKMKKVSLKTGFRLEGAYTDANSKQGVATTTPFNNNVTDVVPYFTLSYKIAESSSVKFNYTQRLQRPGIWYLNPYVDDSRPKMLSYGNPDLKTEKVNSFDVNYSYFSSKVNVEAGLSTQLNNNAIQSITSVRSDGVQVQTYENSGINNSFGANFYGSYRPMPTLSLDFNGDVSYSVMERNGSNGEKLRNEGWVSYLGGSARWTIIKGLSLSAYGGGSTGWLQLQGKSKGYFYNGVSLRKDLLKSKMNVSISVSNPFQEYRTWKSDMKDDTFSSHSENRSLSRTISFGISYRFGKMGAMVKKAQRGINNDDVKGGGGNGGGGNGGGGK
jgi:hypothetical protein